MGKSDPASSEMAAETAALLHLLLYAALACAMSMLGKEHRAPAWRGWEDGNASPQGWKSVR